MLAQTLIVAGALLFGVLGALHLAYTFGTDRFDAAEVTALIDAGVLV